jgi:catechol 2,3-dioxygenase-like lactoylglutathione lyase family enzyme
VKRLHVHVSVNDLEHSVRFYSELFAAAPVVHKPDYAKRMLEDPRVNFAISARSTTVGIEHLGIQVEDREELEQVHARLLRIDQPLLEEGATVCCYANSDKTWVDDPQGVRWETFLTTGESTVYGGDPAGTAAACCVPNSSGAVSKKSSCCAPEDRALAKASSAACCA